MAAGISRGINGKATNWYPEGSIWEPFWHGLSETGNHVTLTCRRYDGFQPGESVMRRELFARSLVFWRAATAGLNAERLPILSYSTADGLPHNTVVRILQDSHGLLWFCTFRGLARFDGYGFKSYDAAQGLRGIVTDLLETREGEYWVATLSGLYQFHTRPANQPMFELYSIPYAANPGVHALQEDSHGVIWAGTNSGLYRLVRENGGRFAHLVDVAVPGTPANEVRIFDLLEARDGAIWAGLRQAGVRRLREDGAIEAYTAAGVPGAVSTPDTSHGAVRSMLEDGNGRIWIASAGGLSVLARDPASGRMQPVRMYGENDGFRNNDPQALLESADGKIWVGTSAGLSEFCGAAECGKNKFLTYMTVSQNHGGVMALGEDREGNVWIGTETGVMRLAREGFATYEESDGLGSSRVLWVSENAAGKLSVVTPGPHGAEINELEGGRFHRISPRLPPSGTLFPEPSRASASQDQAGDWWVATDRGLCYYTGLTTTEDLARIPPKAVYTNRNGLPAAGITSLFSDSRGDLMGRLRLLHGTHRISVPVAAREANVPALWPCGGADHIHRAALLCRGQCRRLMGGVSVS
jgi:ligand-binding sensor domain-containing protein